MTAQSTSASTSLQLEGIAIVGMSARLPGARNVDEFWSNLKNGVESISQFSVEELAAEGVDPELLKNPAYVRARSLLADVDLFDAGFFGYTPNEAANMDPQQRVFLECAWEALENAALDPERYPGAVGVFAGAYMDTYLLSNLCSSREFIEGLLNFKKAGAFQTFLGNDKDYLATRAAYKMNLRGPALTLQTACSTSLVAICQACQSLLTHQCDAAIAGGVTITFPQKKGYLYAEGGMLSPDGHCRAFDDRAQGTVFGSGIGLVVLKRVSDAIADGDRIYAVIKGAALNNDGSSKVSYTAPSVDGQAEAILTAQTLAGVSPDTISYIEAHGTGTPLGDPIEIAALTQAFRTGTDRKQFCALGAVKTNIGHLDVAAGVAGLIKTALALHHRQIPPSLNFEKPNAKIDFANSPFFVNTQLRPWEAGATPRRAGVSSFGVGGTNAHVVLEEAPAVAPAAAPSRPWQVLLLSARNEQTLDTMTARLRDHLARTPDLSFADAAYTLQTGRREFNHRRAIVCRDLAGATAAIEQKDTKRVFTQLQEKREVPVAFLFPGQGSQSLHMGRELRETEPVFREHFDRCLALASAELGRDLAAIISPAGDQTAEAEKLLTQTQFTQPALFAIEYALAQLWLSWGVRPAAMIGHSLGEFVAATIAGVFSLEDAIRLVVRRARLVAARPAGAMLAVRLTEAELQPLLADGVAIAAINAPNLCVASGTSEAIDELESRLRAQNVSTIRLKTSHAFHSAMMEPVVAPLIEEMRGITLNPPQIPYFSNLTARWVTAEEATDPRYWASHVRDTVRFADSVAGLLHENAYLLLEVGPGQTLAALARQQAKPEHTILASLATGKDGEAAALMTALGKLWLAGATIDWNGFYAHEERRRVPLPAYPFERKRHFVEAPHGITNFSSEPAPSAPVAAISVNAVPSAEATASAAPAGNAPLASTAPAVPTQSRRDRIAAELKSLFHELSGVSIDEDQSGVTFLELGFDSLFLTQVRQSFQGRFGVNVTYRQLAESLNTLDALATHIDASAAPDLFAAPAAPAPAVSPAASSVAPTATGDLAGIERMLQQIAQQVAALRGGVPVSAAAPASKPLASKPAAPVKVEAKAFGPFRPVNKSSSALTAHQQEWLASFISGYNQRTARSKEIAARDRAGVADPRSLANYRQGWKELVYQITVEESSGARLRDVDGNEYIDFTMGFGVNLFGHAPQFVMDAVAAQLKKGVHIGPQSPLTGEVAALMREFTGHERVTFCNTGSEAVMAALRLARTVTGRSKVVHFVGDYHGLFDEVLLRPHHADPLRSLPIAPGIPLSAGENMLVLEYGKPESLEFIRQHAGEIAAVLVEPVQSRRPDFQPREFLHELRALTKERDVALIFDEVISGFRMHPRGAQGVFGIKADLATYGKVIGGGLPIGALAGDARFMDALDGGAWNFGDDSGPEADVTFFAGTFVRHPLVLAAAHASLLHLKAAGPQLQEELNRRTTDLADRLNRIFTEAGMPVRVHHFGSQFRLHFESELPYAPLLVYQLLSRGIYFRETHQNCFLSTAHTAADIDRLVEAVRESVATLQREEFLPSAAGHVSSAPVATRFALTDPQREIWLACQLDAGVTRAYNESFTLGLRGSLDADALRSSLNDLGARHEALRLTLAADGETQQAAPQLTLDVPLLDWSTLDATEREQRIAAIPQEESVQTFDLERGPLVRARLCRLSPTHHLLVFTGHHLVFDGWSSNLVLAELAQLYSARVRGTTATLPPATRFSDFARDQAAAETLPAFQAAEAYWTQRFATAPEPISLPTDHPRTAQVANDAGNERLTLDADLHRALKQTGAKRGLTQFSLLLAAFKVLLQKLADAPETVVGIFTAGQLMAGTDNLVGHCVNMLPIRAASTEGQAFAAFAAEVNRAVLDAREHEVCTYGRLLRNLKVNREPGRPPLVDAVFNFEQKGDSGLAFSGLEFDLDQNAKGFVNFELFLNIREAADGLILDLAFKRGLFEPDTIRRWLGHYRTLLAAFVAEPAALLADLPLVDAAQRAYILTEWNATAAEFPRDTCLHQLFEAQARADGNAIAVTDGAQSLTYRELNQRADTLAARLRALRVGPEARVAICLERSIEMVVGILGTLKAGGAYVPLDPAYPQDRLGFMLQDSGAVVLLTDSALRARLPRHTATTLCMDQAEARASENPIRASSLQIEARNLAYIIYTSGSTGRPKGVMVEHRAIVNHLTWRQHAFPLQAGDSFLQKASCSFDISVWELFAPLVAGARLVLARPGGQGDGVYLARVIDEEKITDVHFGPAMLRVMLEDFHLGQCRALRRVFCGGEPLSAELQRLFHARCAATLISQYGPTETTVDATSFICEREAETTTAPIGRPIANTQAYLLDRHLQLVPPGVAGELCLGGESLARGYLNQPELMAEKFVPNPFSTTPGARLYRTGDRCRQRADGVIEFLGRFDAQVKIRGFRIEPGEVQAALATHPDVRESFVTAHADPSGDKRLVAYIVPARSDAAPRDWVGELRGFLGRTLPTYLVPDAFMELAALPLLPNGKLDARALPAPNLGATTRLADSGADAETEFPAAPARPAQLFTETEQALAAIWREILGVADIAADDDFFALGGHSLLAMRMAARLRSSLQIELPMRQIFDTPVLADLAVLVEDRLLERIDAMEAGNPSTASAPELAGEPAAGR